MIGPDEVSERLKGFTREIIGFDERRSTTVKVIKSKQHDYKNGGSKLVETIERVTHTKQVARLSCGHEIVKRPCAPDMRRQQTAQCPDCEYTDRLGPDLIGN